MCIMNFKKILNRPNTLFINPVFNWRQREKKHLDALKKQGLKVQYKKYNTTSSYEAICNALCGCETEIHYKCWYQ